MVLVAGDVMIVELLGDFGAVVACEGMLVDNSQRGGRWVRVGKKGTTKRREEEVTDRSSRGYSRSI
jgi:hypothetical protein